MSNTGYTVPGMRNAFISGTQESYEQAVSHEKMNAHNIWSKLPKDLQERTTIQKNEDKYAYDLKVQLDEQLICYIEIENTPTWINSYKPTSWKNASFLKRKFKIPNDVPILYLKTNCDSTNGYFMWMHHISAALLTNKAWYRSDGTNDRRGEYIDMPWDSVNMGFTTFMKILTEYIYRIAQK